jgi:hypothetical protein
MGYPYPNLTQQGGITCEGPVINGIAMCGQWLLKKARRTFGWQIQQASFMSGATTVPKGDPPMEIEYEVRIWQEGAMTLFLSLCQSILKKPAIAVSGSASAALEIQDPTLAAYGVTSVVVAFVEIPRNPLVTSGGKGPWVGSVGFIEYRKAVAALPVPDQTIPGAGSTSSQPASANLATAAASITSGAGKLQSTTAQRHVPPR